MNYVPINVGKASIKPRRPPPPPPPSEQHTPASQPTLVQPTAAPTHSTAPLPSTGSTASPPQSIAAIPTPQTHHSLNPPTQGSQTTPPLSTIPPPTPLRSPISPVPEETPLVFQAPQIDVKVRNCAVTRDRHIKISSLFIACTPDIFLWRMQLYAYFCSYLIVM